MDLAKEFKIKLYQFFSESVACDFQTRCRFTPKYPWTEISSCRERKM